MMSMHVALDFESYHFIEKLYETRRTTIVRAYSDEFQKNVILKTDSDFAIQDEAGLSREYEFMHSISSPNVLHAHKLLHSKGKSAIVLEDFNGEVLSQVIKKQKISLERFFHIALQIVNGLDDIHKKKIIHRDIKPQNVLVGPNGAVKIFDFNLSSIYEEENLSPSSFEGSLQYIAPEQTGKVSWVVDFRTDFYMLGVTLYELASGMLPFTTADELELVHAHLARTPPPLGGVIPPYLEGLIFKLLSKNPDDRYQTDYGLKKDLEKCLKLWQEHSEESFLPGQYDHKDRLQIPHKLYGRDIQIKEVLSTFNQVCHGRTETIFIHGESGIGKSAFCRELYGQVSLSKAVFVTGKFDQFKKNIPYHAIAEFCEQLVNYFLGFEERKLKKIKNRVLKELDGQGQAIINVIPSFEYLLGKQPELPPVSAHEAQSRFSVLFQKCLSVIVTEETPLVLFLDDLQWADSSSLELIANLAQGLPYFLFLGAYRTKEVDAMHPLVQTVEKMKKQGSSISYLQLNLLKKEEVDHLLHDTLQTTESSELAEVIHQKTDGNPFFVNQLLKFIYQEKLLVFDHEELKWKWNLSGIQQLKITENVVDLVLKRIEMLPPQAQWVLGIAAYLGGSFDLYALFKAASIDFETLQSHLLQIVNFGLLLRIRSDSKAAPNEAEEGLKQIHYSFVHDRIQQASVLLIPESDAPHLRRKIGQLLLDENLASLFEIVFQFNQCLALMKSSYPNQCLSLVKMNLSCVIQAKEAEYYSAALGYADAGLSLLEGRNLEEEDIDQLLFTLSLERAECLYLLGHREEAEKDFSLLLEKSRTPESYIYVCSIFSSLYLYSGSYDKCIQMIKQGMEKSIPEFKLNPSTFNIFVEYLKIYPKMMFKDASALDSYYPDSNSAVFHSLLKLLENAYVYTIVANKENLNFYVSLKTIQLAFTYGFATDIAPNLFALSYFLSVIGQKRQSVAILSLARRLLEKSSSKFAIGVGSLLDVFFFTQWDNGIEPSLELLQRGFRANIEGGHIHFASNCMLLLNNFLIAYGRPLEEILTAQRAGLSFYEKYPFLQSYARTVKIWCAFALKLAKDTYDTYQEDIDSHIAYLQKENDPTNQAAYTSNSIFFYYFLEEFKKAIEDTKIYEKTCPDICKNWFITSQSKIFGILSSFRLEGKKTLDQALKLKNQLMKLSNKTKNYQSVYALLSAKIYQYSDRPGDAIFSFQKAIELAKDQSHLLLLAAAQEEAALFYESVGLVKCAQAYICEAYSTYLKWGCAYKTKLFETRYSTMLSQPYSLEATSSRLTSISRTNLDLYAIIKTHQALSSEIVLKNVLDKIIQVLIETSGAQRGVLILQKHNGLYIAAEGGIDGPIVTTDKPIVDSSLVPYSLIYSVFRTSNHIVLYDLNLPHSFSKDPYFNKTTLPMYILAMPIINKGKTIGALYFENYLTSHIFTPQQLQILNLLSTQAAISLEHAQIYASSGRFVPQEFLKLLNKENITEVEAGDKTNRFMTLLFCDMREFTKFTESIASDEAFDFVNIYLSLMEPPITKQGGFIDKYIGDAIMALFQETADNALIAAIEMTEKLQQLNKERESEGKSCVKVGIGLSSGPLTIGILGSSLRIEGSVIGDTVNVASRVENLNKLYGTTILISQNTKASITHIDRFHLRLIDEVILRGKSTPVEVWEVLDTFPKDVRDAKIRIDPLFQQARQALKENRTAEAHDLLQQCLAAVPDDSVFKFFLNL